jgi:hypothetical protein
MTAAMASITRAQVIRTDKPEKGAATKEKTCTVMIARNKHWRNIAAYHGSWLQLPIEMLEYLCLLNITAMPYSSDMHDTNENTPETDRHINANANHSNRDTRVASPASSLCLSLQQEMPKTSLLSPPKDIHRPAIDPIVLADLLHTRTLVDEASELVVAAMQVPIHTHGSGSSSIGMHTRRKLLRRAVEKMATAYRTDEVAASVNAMQAASGLDDLVDRLVSISPDDAYTNDVIYTRFFHEKIPSR